MMAHPWMCPRPGWVGLRATWSSGTCRCPQQNKKKEKIHRKLITKCSGGSDWCLFLFIPLEWRSFVRFLHVSLAVESLWHCFKSVKVLRWLLGGFLRKRNESLILCTCTSQVSLRQLSEDNLHLLQLTKNANYTRFKWVCLLVKTKKDICRDSQAIILSQLLMQLPSSTQSSCSTIPSRNKKNGTIKGGKLGQKSWKEQWESKEPPGKSPSRKSQVWV